MTPSQAFKQVTGLEVEEGIKKAIEGGYNDKEHLWKLLGLSDKSNPEYLGEDMLCAAMFYQERIFLDPFFWKALGKAEGWKIKKCISCGCGHRRECFKWQYHFHRFIEALAEEKVKTVDAEDPASYAGE